LTFETAFCLISIPLVVQTLYADHISALLRLRAVRDPQTQQAYIIHHTIVTYYINEK
jgi:hypothetical protein